MRCSAAESSTTPTLLGQGDTLQEELLDIPELSGTFSIGLDGTMVLPRLRVLYV
jgi:polysaccharide export outer membrane protein